MTMALPAAVGANLWLVAVLLPLILERSWVMMPGRGLVALLLMALLPLGALSVGLRQRSLVALFIAFPFGCALPELLLGARGDQAGLVGPAPLPLVAAVLVGYLLAASRALGRRDAADDPAPQANQPLPSAATPTRWKRRMRVYRGMVVVAALFPTALLGWALGWPANRDAFEASFGAHTDEALAAATAGVGLLWMALYRVYFLGPLDGHLHHDRELRIQLEMARRQARRGRPRPTFYVAVVCALGAMAAVLWQRAR